MFRQSLRALIVPVLALLSGSAAAGTLFVDAQLTTGANDGSSWSNAFQTSDGLQQALAVSTSGDDIFVADGLYLPTQTGSRTVGFKLLNGVTLFGGFAGGEATPAERPPFGTAPSVLSGDLAGNDGAGTLSDNSYHVIRTGSTNKSAVIDGFTVRAGNANGSGNNNKGGGILCVGNVSPTVRNCHFKDNRSSFGGAAGYCNGGAAPTFTDCTFEDGVGGSFGGAFDIASGGLIRFERCSFLGNTASRAGALEVFNTTGVIVNNCLFTGNVATGSSGGGAVWVGSGGNTKFKNCTIAGNSSTVNQVGGLRNQGATGTTVENCIIWGNTGPGGVQGPNNQVTASTNVTYTIVMGGFAGTGNLAGDPLFTNPFGGDFQLDGTSPGIDAGNNAAVAAGFTLDLALNPRQSDAPAVPDTGAGTAPLVDMGALEFTPAAFVSHAGCFANPVTLTSTSASLQVGQPLMLQSVSTTGSSGIALYYSGVASLDALGCGTQLPGLGELMLALAPAPTLLGTAATVAGSASFAFNVPVLPALVGLPAALQAVHVDVITPGTPLELSDLLTTVVLP